MTFTEAAVEVLRRAGKPLHYRQIAGAALQENLLSHVGQDPELTMGQRLAAMAKRDEDRKVVAIAPEGTFALLEWGVPQDVQVEPVPPPLQPEDAGEALYRPREREPRPIHAQARRRLAELQAEHEEGSEEVEAERRRQDQLRGKGQRRFPPPAEVVFEALAERQTGAPLAELAAELLKRQLLSDALVRDLPSLVAALLEDNRRRTEVGRKPAFIVDGDRVTLVEFPPPSAPPDLAEARAPHAGARPMGAAQLAAEIRRAVARGLRRRLAELDTPSFENLCATLLERMGMRDVRVAKRSKEGPLYLARQRRGVSDLRVAVKLVRGAREIGRNDVQELRKDLAHYSAQMGLVLAPGEAGRDARSEASAAGQAPVALYVGEALPEELIACRVGVTVQSVEVPDLDEAFLAGLSRHREERPFRDDRQRDEAARGDRSRDERARDERRPRERPEPQEEPRNAGGEPAAAQPPQAEPAQERPPGEPAAQEPVPVGAPAPPEAVVEPAAAEAAPPEAGATPADARESRRRRGGGREERPRATTPAEQAWGQPAGTLRFAAPPGPTVVAPEESAEASPAPAEEQDEPESPAPDLPKSGPF
ncbi:MAG TPA: restriction endonuclease [Myxococcales bacterium]|nr:restriction endonuclease [Myxococcales bacterium]